MSEIRCSLGHAYDDSADACPVCGEKRAGPPPPPTTSQPLVVPEGAFSGRLSFTPPEEAAEPEDAPSAPPFEISATLGDEERRAQDEERRAKAVREKREREAREELELDEALKSPLPTIAVVGYPSVGKSFFIRRLGELTRADGYRPDTLVYVDRSPAEVRARGPEPAAGEDGPAPPRRSRPRAGGGKIETTLTLQLHEFTRREGPNFRIVDIPGEFFDAMMGEQSSHGDLLRLDDPLVRRLWKVIARADAFILLIPATELAYLAEHTGVTSGVDVLSDYLQALRDVNRLLESELSKRNNDLAAAVKALQEMSDNKKRAAARANLEPLHKPFLLLYSKADEVLGAAPNEVNPDGLATVVPHIDYDPMLASAQKSGGFLKQLCEAFAVFRIDFVTAYEGLPPDGDLSKEPDPRLGHHGVWEAITWALDCLKLAARGATLPPTEPLLEMRAAWDGRFGRAFRARPKPGPPPTPAGPPKNAESLWKPPPIWLRIYLIPSLLAAALCWLAISNVFQVNSTPRGASTLRVNAPLEQLWTGAERDRLSEAAFFRAGAMQEDLGVWEVTPRTGIGSVRPAARSGYEEALRALQAALTPGADRNATDLSGARAQLGGAAGDLGAVERVPILYHEALAAFLAGDIGPVHALLGQDRPQGGGLGGLFGGGRNEAGGVEETRGALFLINAARRSANARARSEADTLRLDGEEIAVRRLLGHALMSERRYDDAAEQFTKAIEIAERARRTQAYRRTYSMVFQLRPQQHLISLSTGALWNDYIAARLAGGGLPDCGEGSRERYCRLYLEPRQAAAYPPLTVSLAMLAAREGRRGRVQSLSLDTPPAGAELTDAYVLARRAMGLGAAGAAPSATLLDELAVWDQIACRRAARTPVAGEAPAAACPDASLGEFGNRWEREFDSRYARVLQRQVSGDRAIASDHRFGWLERWYASERLHGRWPWLSAGLIALLSLLTGFSIWRAWRLNRRYERVFRPLHERSRRAGPGVGQALGGLARALATPQGPGASG